MEQISLSDSTYPPLLKELRDAPTSLYVRGNLSLLQSPHLLGVVGSRKATAYGKQAIEKTLTPCISARVIVVSGLAYGIDSLAHQAAVNQKKPTIAVLGTGIDDASIYPHANKSLAKKILEYDGLLVSEYEPGTKPLKHHFPARNRIIAGLCSAILIVQAAKKSGSLITARLAMENNRDVLAIPGNITDETSEGTNDLIRDGAVPITSSSDIFTELSLEPEVCLFPTISFTPIQAQIIEQITNAPQHIDDIATNINLPTSEVSAILLELELLEAVEHVGNMKYMRKHV